MEEESSVDGLPVNPLKSAPKKAIDRVTLGAEESERTEVWISQLRDTSKGFLDLNKSDVINFLVRAHPTALTAKEIKLIRAANYDPIRHLNWITPRLKEALAKSDMAQVGVFQSEIRGIELSVISKAKESSGQSDSSQSLDTKRKRRKKSQLAETEEPLSFKEIQTNLPEG